MTKYEITPEAKLTEIMIELKDISNSVPLDHPNHDTLLKVYANVIFELGAALLILKKKP